MLSFVGWEAVAPLTTRFRDPARQLPRVTGIAFGTTALLYLGLAVATVSSLGRAPAPTSRSRRCSSWPSARPGAPPPRWPRSCSPWAPPTRTSPARGR